MESKCGFSKERARCQSALMDFSSVVCIWQQINKYNYTCEGLFIPLSGLDICAVFTLILSFVFA